MADMAAVAVPSVAGTAVVASQFEHIPCRSCMCTCVPWFATGVVPFVALGRRACRRRRSGRERCGQLRSAFEQVGDRASIVGAEL